MITKKAEYAINILAELAGRDKDRFYSSREVAAVHATPSNLVPQLVSALQKGGLIQSARGPSGGIRLLVDPGDISLRQVIELFDGPVGLTRCLTQPDYCAKSSYCPLHRIWSRTQEKMLSELEHATIKDLAEAYNRHSPGEKLEKE
ncbi:MAG: Rrf2 family transcriptional regulator [Dethiobacter sp.]|nr:MAG: Rrf2 family transcriptional regulator [Dethiobacter sp.]